MRKAIGIAFGLAIVVGILVTAFVWPTSQLAPRDVPIAVAGPPDAVAQVEEELSAAAPDAFDIEPVSDAEAARQAIGDRDVYGAVVLDPSGPPQLLTASSASPIVAQLLEGVAGQMAGGEDAPTRDVVDVVDVAPLPADDPRGAGFSSGALPMVMAGLAVGIVMAFTVTGIFGRVVGAVVAAAAGGMVAVLVMQTWLGVLDGSWWANAGVFALTIGAVSLTIVGLHALIAEPGIGVGALIMLLIGNPLSGVTSAPEMLPSGWGAFGQALPPGAGGSLLRSTAYFDGAGAGGPLVVLVSWAAAGLLLAALGGMVARRRRAIPDQRRDQESGRESMSRT